MRNVSPSRILILLLYVGIMSAVVLFLSPGEVELGQATVRIPQWDDVLPRQGVEEEEELAEETVKVEEVAVVVADTLTDQATEEAPKVHTRPGDIAIEYPGSDPLCMDAFFTSLDQISHYGEPVRVMHYGDSQLEGDRMTERLRRNLQGQFGGSGLGLVPFTEVNNIRSTLRQEQSGPWDTYAIYNTFPRSATSSDYGFFGKYTTFSGHEGEEASASVVFNRTGYTRQSERKFENLLLYMRNREADLSVYCTFGGRTDTLTVPMEEQSQVLKLPAAGQLGEVKLAFASSGAPEFYGISFESRQGIVVDNLAMRGSSGTDFAKIHKAHFKQLTDQMNVGLIILQFGVNMVPQEVKNYGFYERSLVRQINYLQSICPGASILVVGVSDMAHKEGTDIVSYDNISAISAAQRRAAAKAGAAFWDLYKAMGGRNAIVRWADRKPAWANADYTHFTRKGANHVGDMLYNELMREYAKFRKRRKTI